MKRFVLLLALLVLVPSAVRAESPPPPACEEDEECWDCTTMGNQVCGLMQDGALWLCSYLLPDAPLCEQVLADGTTLRHPDWMPGEPYRHLCPEVFTDSECEGIYATPIPVPQPGAPRFTG